MPDEPKLHVVYTGDPLTDSMPLSKSQMTIFRDVLKAGIYKELYRQKTITSTQLNELLNHLQFFSGGRL